MSLNFYDPSYWHSRAEEARIIAEGMNDAAKPLLLKVAEDFDLLAKLAKFGLEKSRSAR